MKCFLTFVFLIQTFSCIASRELRSSLKRNNLHFEFTYYYKEREIYNKFKILIELSEKLLEVKKSKDISIYIDYFNTFCLSDTVYTTVSYGNFKFDNFSKSPSNNVRNTGLIININDEDLNIKAILNLIENSIDNLSYIKGNAISYQFKPLYGDTINLQSIPLETINAYKKNTSTEVKSIINLKTWHQEIEPIFKYKYKRADYYYQNNLFHFFNNQTPIIVPDSISGSYKELKFGKHLISVPSIKEILGKNDNDMIIFINDSTFHSLNENGMSEPFTISTYNQGRSAIMKLIIESNPIKHIIFKTNDIDDVIFFPDSSVVVFDYQEKQNEFMYSISSTKNNNQVNENKDSTNYLIYILAISLLLNVIVLIVKYR